MKWKRWILFGVRVALSCVFILSGFTKLMGPYQNFLAVVYEYKILPAPYAQWFAVSLPWAELIFGVFLLKGLWTRLSLEVLWFMNTLFLVAVGSAMLRKLPITECGCFGDKASMPLPAIFTLDIGLWLLFALLFFFSEDAKWLSIDDYFRKK